MTIKRQWAAVTAAVCFLVLIAGYLLLVHPQHTKVTSVKAQTSGVDAQVQTLKAQVATLMEEKRNEPTEEAALARIMQQLPTDPELPTLLRTLDAAATKNQVELVNVAPGNPAAFVAPATAAATAPTATSSSGTSTSTTATQAQAQAAAAVSGLSDIPVILTVSGNYYGIEGFLDSVEGLKRSMLVNSFGLSYKAQTSTAGSSTAGVGVGEITATVNAEIFLSSTASTTAGGASGTTTTTTTTS